MANWLTNYVNKYLSDDENIIDFCCGNGLVSSGLRYSEITGVDVSDEYLEQYRKIVPRSKIIKMNLLDYASGKLDIKNKNFDNVICLDGVEHLEKDMAINLIEKMEKLAVKRVIIFTPENASDCNAIVLNSPNNAWGIKNNDHWQIHRSAFPRSYFIDNGYVAIQINKAKNIYDNSFYYEMLYVKNK